jgi:hypothetical protein
MIDPQAFGILNGKPFCAFCGMPITTNVRCGRAECGKKIKNESFWQKVYNKTMEKRAAGFPADEAYKIALLEIEEKFPELKTKDAPCSQSSFALSSPSSSGPGIISARRKELVERIKK